jgi:hypothetical protein
LRNNYLKWRSFFYSYNLDVNGLEQREQKLPTQTVGNIGLYYVCYELSKRGWNVLPTSRNARGIDIIIYNQIITKTHSIQVKALSKKAPVPLGSNLENLIAEFIIICRNVSENPELFVAKVSEIRDLIHKGVKGDKVSYWLQPKDYLQFKDKWDKIGSGR